MSPDSEHRQYLAFHKLAERYPFESTCYPIAKFERLLERLAQAGLSLYDGDSGEVVITFADGYAHLANLLPDSIIRYRFKPIVFMPTFWIDQANKWDFSFRLHQVNHLTAEQIESLSDQGVTFGSHGHSHTNLKQLTDRELEAELKRSREILHDLTGQSIDTISYPFGRTDERVTQAARKAGYTQGFTLRFPSQTDPALSTGRFAVYSWDTAETVIRKLRQGRGFWYEKVKARITNFASNGTILINRLRK